MSSSSEITNGGTRMLELVERRQAARRALRSAMTWTKVAKRQASHSASGHPTSRATVVTIVKQAHGEWHRRVHSIMQDFLDAVFEIVSFSVSLVPLGLAPPKTSSVLPFCAAYVSYDCSYLLTLHFDLCLRCRPPMSLFPTVPLENYRITSSTNQGTIKTQNTPSTTLLRKLIIYFTIL